MHDFRGLIFKILLAILIVNCILLASCCGFIPISHLLYFKRIITGSAAASLRDLFGKDLLSNWEIMHSQENYYPLSGLDKTTPENVAMPPPTHLEAKQAPNIFPVNMLNGCPLTTGQTADTDMWAHKTTTQMYSSAWRWSSQCCCVSSYEPCPISLLSGWWAAFSQNYLLYSVCAQVPTTAWIPTNAWGDCHTITLIELSYFLQLSKIISSFFSTRLFPAM